MIIQLQSVSSTNDYLLEKLQETPHGDGVYTLNQTHGRGRRGNRWAEPAGKGIALSLVFHELPSASLSVLPLLVGIGVKRGLEQLGVTPWLKWSNDIILEEKKLGGILCESRMFGSGASVVVGIGLNLKQTAEDFRQQEIPHAISLVETAAANVPITDLVNLLANECSMVLLQWQNDDFSFTFREEYERSCITLGREIRILLPAGEQTGMAIGITEQGELLWKKDGVLEKISSGNVSVRGINGYL